MKATAAAFLADDVPSALKERRSVRLMAMGERMNYLFRRSFLVSVREAIFEMNGAGRRPRESGRTERALYALTDNYIRVRVAESGTGRPHEREKLPLEIVEVAPSHTLGRLVQP
jgi:tRNA A37 methylthiotransferase MiaB